MLGRFFMAAIAGLVVWKYRDTLREYAKGNFEPAREKVDVLLRTVQSTSEVLLDQAKEQLSSRLGSAREKVRVSGSEPRETERPKSSDSGASLSPATSVHVGELKS